MSESFDDPQIRRATVQDVSRMLDLINGYAAEQVMLARSPLVMFETLRDFVVLEDDDGLVIGCGGLHVVWGDMAEVRSVAVDPKVKGQGVGRRICEQLLQDARDLQVPCVYTFTYVPGFFEKLGFRQVEHSELPHKVFGDCLNCPKFNACDEIAMVCQLVDPRRAEEGLERDRLSLGGLAQSPFPLPTRAKS
jgi:amino-acid N-acetyltransferase